MYRMELISCKHCSAHAKDATECPSCTGTRLRTNVQNICVPAMLAVLLCGLDFVIESPPEVQHAAQQRALIDSCWAWQKTLSSTSDKDTSAQKCFEMEEEFKVMHDQNL